MGHVLTAGSSARPRGTAAATSQAGRPSVLPIVHAGIATPCAVWATLWFLQNVVDPGCGDLFFGCLGTIGPMFVFGLIEVVAGGIVAAALPSRASAWQRLVGLSAGLALSLALIAVVRSGLQEPFEWTYLHDPGGLAASVLSHWAGLMLYVGGPALVACGLALLARLVVRSAADRAQAIAARAEARARPEAATRDAVRFWDGMRRVDEGAVPTDGRSGRDR